MATHLGTHIDVLAVQYPGRHDRFTEELVTSIDGLADHAADALLPYLDRPTALFGHSMGASVAFEVAIRIEARGYHLEGLIASGHGSPSAGRDSRIHELDRDALARELISIGATDPSVVADPELLELVLPAIRADFKAIETYRHRDGLRTRCPVVVLHGDDDPEVNLSAAAAWRDHAGAEFTLHRFPGGHFFLEPHAESVLDVICRTFGIVRSCVTVFRPSVGTEETAMSTFQQ